MRERKTWIVILLNIITFGLYDLFYNIMYGINTKEICYKKDEKMLSYQVIVMCLMPFLTIWAFALAFYMYGGVNIAIYSLCIFIIGNGIWRIKTFNKTNGDYNILQTILEIVSLFFLIAGVTMFTIAFSMPIIKNVNKDTSFKDVFDLLKNHLIQYKMLFIVDMIIFFVGNVLKNISTAIMNKVMNVKISELCNGYEETITYLKDKEMVSETVHVPPRKTGFISEINAYGFKYSISNFYRQLALAFGGTIAISFVFKLQWYIIFLLIAIIGMLLPALIKNQYAYLNEQNRFSQITSYMEQMIYSFKRNPKILSALRDCVKITNGTLQECIKEAIEIINKMETEDTYERAFKVIEKEYKSRKLKNLHKFMIKIERDGGKYQQSIDIMLEDIRSFQTNTYSYQQSIATIKKNVLISSACALGVSGAMIYMIPKEYTYTSNPVYQIVSFLVLVAMILIYFLISSRVKGTWLDVVDKKHLKSIKQCYKVATTYTTKQLYKMTIPIYVVILICIPLAYFLNSNIMYLALAMFAIFFAIQPATRIKGAKKRIENENTRRIFK